MDTLAFYMFNVDGVIESVNFGNSPRRSSADVMFRVRNLSSTYTANDVTVSLRGDRAFTYWLSLDGDRFAATVHLGDMAPGTWTEGVTLRRVTPTDAPLGEEAIEVVAEADHWVIDTAPTDDDTQD